MKPPLKKFRSLLKSSTVLVAGLCAVLCFAGAAGAAAQQLKVGVVDMNKIFTAYYKTRDAENKMNEARENAKKEFDDRMESHRQLLDEINQLNKDIDNKALSDAARSDRQKKREDKINQVRVLEQEIQEFKNSREKQLQEQVVRMRNQIVEEIMAIINAKVKSDNFDLVFDKSGQSLGGVPVVLHANDRMEFSDDVITALNRNRPTSAAASAAPAAPPKH